MPEPKSVRFEIAATDGAAAIYLINSAFQLVKKGIGRETFSVPPGIYKVKNRCGRTVDERLIVVREGMSDLKLGPVRVSSALPLRDAARTHEYHGSAAGAAARTTDLSHGSGSHLVIVARQWTGPAPRASQLPPPNPARGLSLLDAGGTLVADVAALTRVSGTLDPIVTLNVELSPGPYRLSLARADGRRVEQTVIAAPGWQTHVYLLVQGTVEAEAARVDLVNAAITLQQPGWSFDPADTGLRAEEIARGALQESHNILAPAVRQQFTDSAAAPMLALFGAHLLIREARDAAERLADEPGTEPAVVDQNRPELRAIVANLRAALGTHPDIEAVAVAAGNPDPGYRLDAPPMLRASWPLLLELSAARPGAIPADSAAAFAAERIWGEGTWLQWLAAGPETGVDRAALWQEKARQVLASFGPPAAAGAAGAIALDLPITGMATGLPPVLPRSPVAGAAGMVFRSAKRIFTERVRTPFPTEKFKPSRAEPMRATGLRRPRAALSDEQRAQLVKQLGVPLSRIDAWIEQSG